MAERSQFLKQSGIGIIGNLIAAVLATLYISILSHRITAAEYGLVASALSLGYIASLILNPLESDVSRLSAICHGQRAPAKLRSITERKLTRSAASMLLVLVVWVPVSFLLKEWLRFPSIGPLLWLGLFFALSFPGAIFRGVLRGDRRFSAYAVSQVVESTARITGGFLALEWGLAASGAVLGYASGMAVVVLLGFWQLRDVFEQPKIPFEAQARPISTALLCFSFYLLFVVNVDVLMAKHYLEPREAGHYGAAATLSRMIYLAATPLYQVLFSHVVAQHTRGESSRRLTIWVGAALASALLLGLVIPTFAGIQILTFLFGSDYVNAASVLRIVWLSTSLLVVEALFGFFLIGENRLGAASLFLLPCVLMMVLLLFFHGGPVQIAYCGLAAVLAGGTILAWTGYRSAISTTMFRPNL